jgi:hypothetical protein
MGPGIEPVANRWSSSELCERVETQGPNRWSSSELCERVETLAPVIEAVEIP